MKIVIGLFTPEAAEEAVSILKEKGFHKDNLSLMASVSEVPHYLEDEIEGQPEQKALQGAAIGGVAGGTAGALGAWAASAIPGFEAFSAAGLMTTTAGSVIGAFLGGLYRTRAEEQTYMDLHQEIESGKVLLVVRTNEEGVEPALAVLNELDGQDVEVHELPF